MNDDTKTRILTLAYTYIAPADEIGRLVTRANILAFGEAIAKDERQRCIAEYKTLLERVLSEIRAESGRYRHTPEWYILDVIAALKEAPAKG